MKKSYRILRHVTNIDYLNSIVVAGALKGEFGNRPGDNQYISFEANPTNDALFRVFYLLKDWNPVQSFELLFDGEKLLQSGYEIHSTIDGKHFSKVEIDFVLRAKGKDEISKEIGDYAFIKDNVPLKFLTSDSKRKVENWAHENHLNEAVIKRALCN